MDFYLVLEALKEFLHRVFRDREMPEISCTVLYAAVYVGFSERISFDFDRFVIANKV